jgi:hypothetical protein
MTGLRTDTSRRPGDITGQVFLKQQAELRAKKAYEAAQADYFAALMDNDSEPADTVIDYTDSRVMTSGQ